VISLSELNGHLDLGAYTLGLLSELEAARFEAHLAECAGCREELGELERAAAILQAAAPAAEPWPGLEGRVLLAVERAAGAEQRRPASRRQRRLRLPLAFAGAGAAIAAAIVVVFLNVGGPSGSLELEAVLRARSGSAQASVEVRKTGIGRVITFRSESLPILPKNEYYELWFVGPGDRPSRPNRISAGTFHPDAAGRSHVRFAAAVDPAKYPVLSVTAEPGDGDPRATGAEVLRSRR
jgi:anti-sigma-K factor RskA